MKIPGQEVPDAEKALLEKTSKLEDLLAEVRSLVTDVKNTVQKDNLYFKFSLYYDSDNDDINDSSHRIVREFHDIVELMGWRSSSLGC
jgi:tagatose-1,6-bisphosphate aldolase